MSGARTRIDAPPPCAPTGDLGRPATRHSVCITPGCSDRTLTHRPRPVEDRTLDCWEWVDSSGRATIDLRPAEMVDDPMAWWTSLARDRIEVYSSLDAAIRLGHWTWWHRHNPGTTYVPGVPQEEVPPPPFCHDRPMFAGVTGWVCRVQRTVWSYPPEGR